MKKVLSLCALILLGANPASAQSGVAVYERWNNVTISDPALLAANPNHFGRPPDVTQNIANVQAPLNITGSIGPHVSRIRFQFVAPTTGVYIFWIASRGKSKVWISPDQNFANEAPAPIAKMMQTVWPNSNQWTRHCEMKSGVPAPATVICTANGASATNPIVSLNGATTYQVLMIGSDEVLEATNLNHMSLAWQLPNEALQGPIPGSRVSVPPPAPPAGAPVVTLTANPTSMAAGQTSTLTWSATNNPTSCTASNGWSGAKATSGSQNVTPSSTMTYTLTCVGAGGTSTPRSVTVTVVPRPTANIIASPSTIGTGQSSSLNWGSTNATGCTASNGWSGAKTTSGNQQVTPSSTMTYTITCTGIGGTSDPASAVVTVQTASPPTLNFAANPSLITAGNQSLLTWTTTGATGCTASNGWSGAKATSGNQQVSPSATITYRLSCTGPGGAIAWNVTVTVGATPRLAWNANAASDQVTNYIIRQSQNQSGPFTDPVSVGTATQANLPGYVGSWCFVVQAQNAVSTSVNSAVVCELFY